MSWVLWFHRFRSVNSFIVSYVSWCQWFHGFIGFVVSMVFLWLHMFRGVNGFMVEKVSWFHSGAPARSKGALNRAPYSWNMVNLFSFGCHVIDRAYVRTYVRVYRLYGWGRGDYQKELKGVSGVS